MEVKKYFGKGVMRCLNVLALLLVMQTANSVCIWVAHQPEFPEAANKFNKYLQNGLCDTTLYILYQYKSTKGQVFNIFLSNYLLL